MGNRLSSLLAFKGSGSCRRQPIPRLSMMQESTGVTLTGSVSIVALHGLNGHSINTWTTGSGHMWLQDLLPNDTSNARILTYGYDTNPSIANFDNIEHLAQDFLALLRDSRRDVGVIRTFPVPLLMCTPKNQFEERKLILIGYSLGGILIKEVCFYFFPILF